MSCSYCNSVLQCLYFSERFREQVLTFPHAAREHSDGLQSKLDSRISNGNGALSPVSAGKLSGSFPPMSPTGPKPNQQPLPPNSKPEDNKESFDFQKKQAMLVGPHIKMEDPNYEAYGMPESLFTSLKDIFEALILNPSRTGIVTPAKFLEVLRRNFELFRSPMHQDAHEFLNLLLNDVVEQVETFSKKAADAENTLKRLTSKPNTSWVHELFEGTLASETRCLTCETTSQRDEVFLDLSVDLEEHSSVTSCLARFSQEEMLCERNKFHCDRCGGLQEAEKRMKIKRLPRILALHLKRFKYTEDYGRLQKLFHRVVYPFHLRLLNTTDDAEDPDRVYELYAVIVHLGSTPFHGHYVSIIKTKDRGWLLFDDELVIPVDRNYVRNYFGGDPRNPACAYVLFYQETTEEAIQREQDIEDAQGETLAGAGVNDFIAGRMSTSVPLSPPMSATDRAHTPMHENGDPFADPPEVRLPSAAPLRSAQVPVIANPLEARYSKAPDQSPTVGMTPASSSEPTAKSPVNIQRQPSRYRSSAIIDEEPADDVVPQPAKTSTNFSRFRPASMSMRSKSKIWSSGKDKDDPASSPSSAVAEDTQGTEKDKSKSGRFSLSRKRMSFIGTSK